MAKYSNALCFSSIKSAILRKMAARSLADFCCQVVCAASAASMMAGTLLAEAKRSAMIYGLDLTLVLLTANAGFGAANNVAAQYAASPRLIIMNPDVFPHDQDWAAKHIAVLGAIRPGEVEFTVM